MARRPAQPINQQAAQAADEDVYQRHEADARPNSLYDEEGNRQPIDPNAPSQGGVLREWVAAYEQHGGEVEASPAADREADETTERCPYAQDTVDVIIDFHYLLHQEATHDDTATLSNDDTDGPTYEQTHNLNDDAHVEEVEDNYLRVTFTDVYPRRKYKLFIDPGVGPAGEQLAPYFIFRKVELPKTGPPMPGEGADATMGGQLDWHDELAEVEESLGEIDEYALYSEELKAPDEVVPENDRAAQPPQTGS